MRRATLPGLILIIGAVLLSASDAAAQELLLHPKYHLPARCFAYVGDEARPSTWKLPYRLADGQVDRHRLPIAIQAVLSTYRGRKARIPEAALPEVLTTLGRAAAEIGKLPPRAAHARPIYHELADALAQRGLLDKALGD